MANPAESEVQNLLPVQAYFDAQGNFQTFIGQGQPFYASANPDQSGLNITSSTINSTTIGAITPSTGAFTNISATTGTVSTAPVGATDIANKQYVDYYAAGLSWKAPVLTATSGNITLSGLQTINGVTVVAGDRVLVKDQSTASQNGIYIASASAWTYAVGADDWAEYVGAIVFVSSGSLNGTAWYCTAQPGGTLGVTALNWSNFSVASSYTAGTGLTLTGTQFSITNTGVSAATYGSATASAVIAVNAQGQITSASSSTVTPAVGSITGLGTGVATALAAGVTGSGNIALATSPSFVTPILGTPQSGDFSTGTFTWPTFNQNTTGTATKATNLVGGASGSLPYQSASDTTTFLSAGTNGQVLTLASGVPSWATPTVGTVTSVSGTGTVSGISLSGTVTSSGSLTLGGTLDLSSPPIIGGTAPNSATFTTATATSFETNVAAAGVTLSGTSLVADGSDTNINMLITPKGTGGLGINGSPTGDVAGSTLTAKFCVKQDESGPVAGFVKANNSSAYPGSTVYGCRSRGTLLSPTIVQNGDTLFSLLGLGYDGTDLAPSAQINIEVDGTPGSNDMPGRIVFSTSPDGSQTTTEAMRITSAGNVGIGTNSPTQSLDVNGNSAITGTGILSLQRPLIPSSVDQGTPQIAFRYYSTGTTYTTGAQIQALTASAWSSTSAPTSLSFSTVPSGSTTLSERMRLDSAGNIGIGVTPSAWAGRALQIGLYSGYGNDANGNAIMVNNAYNDSASNFRYVVSGLGSGQYRQSFGSHQWYIAPSGTAGNAITFTQAMTLDASGNLGIGTASPLQKLDMSGTTARFSNGSYVGYLGAGSTLVGSGTATDFTLRSDNVLSFGTGGPYERARISSAGGFSVGTTADPGAGAIYATGNITAYYSSDIKFKENVRQIDNATQKAIEIGGKYFDWTDSYIESKGGLDNYFIRKNDIGVIAQDVQKVLPEAVRTRDDGSLAVDYQKLVSLAFAAIAELQAQINELKAK